MSLIKTTLMETTFNDVPVVELMPLSVPEKRLVRSALNCKLADLRDEHFVLMNARVYSSSGVDEIESKINSTETLLRRFK